MPYQRIRIPYRCNIVPMHVPALPALAPAVSKKPRIDLNVGYLGTTSSRTYTGITHDIAAVSCMKWRGRRCSWVNMQMGADVPAAARSSLRSGASGMRRTAEATRRTWQRRTGHFYLAS
jgi:hypothetical protein